jgi:hypothetical protein
MKMAKEHGEKQKKRTKKSRAFLRRGELEKISSATVRVPTATTQPGSRQH